MERMRCKGVFETVVLAAHACAWSPSRLCAGDAHCGALRSADPSRLCAERPWWRVAAFPGPSRLCAEFPCGSARNARVPTPGRVDRANEVDEAIDIDLAIEQVLDFTGGISGGAPLRFSACSRWRSVISGSSFWILSFMSWVCVSILASKTPSCAAEFAEH